LLNLKCEIGKDFNDASLWLLNEKDENEEITAARELFGFNTGTFTEVTAGLLVSKFSKHQHPNRF